MNAPVKDFNTTTRSKTCDVMIIGGGPGGSATAGMLARQGLNVVLVDKDHHPRFHIGESLLPFSMPILDDLGLLDRVHEIGVVKRGAEFIDDQGSKEVVFEFRRAFFGGPKHAYQVRRSEFDKLLFDRAGELGAETLQGTTAKVTGLEDNQATIRTRDEHGIETDWTANFLIDASGRSTLVSKMLSEKTPDPRNTSAAIFGHFHGVERSQGERAGNIRIHLTNPGWMWQIPLRDGTTSIGLVAPGDYMAARDGGIDPFFRAHCARHPHIQAMIEDAELVEPLRATGNFSYRSTHAVGTCHVKVGDAYGFLDPIFSTGVHLALLSAQEASQLILQAIKDPKGHAKRLDSYEKKIRDRYTYVSWFVYNIHDPTFRQLVMNPQNILGCEEAVISLLAGDFRQDWRLRSRIALFKFFRYMLDRGQKTAAA
ncbi:MAG: NAD(P)/FAD-dependent oxidoreductase [Pseudomonadota bacterium]